MSDPGFDNGERPGNRQKSKSGPPVNRHTAFRAWLVAGQYALFGVLWILLSDGAVRYYVDDPATMAYLQTFKGLAFVGLSVLVIFLLVRRESQHVRSAVDALVRETDKRENLDKQLRQTTWLLETAESIAGLGSWEYRPGSNRLVMSSHLQEMLRCDPNKPFSLKTYLRCFHPGDVPALLEAFRDMARGQQPYLPEIRSHPRLSPQRVFHAECRVLTNDNNEPVNFYGTLQDITERKEHLKDLSIAAVAFEVQEAIVILDREGLIRRINKAFTNITGFSREDVIGKPLHFYRSGVHGSNLFPWLLDYFKEHDHWEGEIWQRRRNGEKFPAWVIMSAVRDNGDGLTNYVCSFTDISERKLAELEIHRLAYFDPLTKLANRRLLADHVEHALATSSRGGECAALMILDLDRFKNLNDTHGHVAGDELLIQVSRRLKRRARKTDTVARLGGDEFVILLESLGPDIHGSARKAHTAAHLFKEDLSYPYHLEAVEDYRLSASIGITVFQGDDADFHDLLRQADVALYASKAEGRNVIRFFNRELQEAVAFRSQIENDLHRALEKDEMRLYYQPQVDNAGNIVGAEALLRWFHRGIDNISPGDFIPVAEESGAIVPIGYWVMEEACRQIVAWTNTQLSPSATVSVNVSARQFQDPDFLSRVQAILERTGVDPGRLKLELTETSLLENLDQVIGKMAELRKANIRFALDDFGTGYCSLIYLKKLPFEQVKVDASFVRDVMHDPSDAEIVRTILAMSRTLGFDTIAEGVETHEQRHFLAESGCEKFQGFLFARPMRAEEFEAFLKRPAPLAIESLRPVMRH